MVLKILIPDRITSPDIESRILKDYDITTYNAKSADEITDRIWNRCDGILAWHDIVYNRKLISKLHNCKYIVRCGVGYDNVDLQAAKDNNIIVCNVQDYGTEEVATYTIGLILLLARGIYKHIERVKDNDWEWHLEDDIHRISEQTLGIIGYGRIGSSVARKAESLGFNVIYYDPYVHFPGRVHSLDKLLEESDIISINCNLTDETRNMVKLKNMKEGTIVVNTARGDILDIDGLDNIQCLITDVSEYKENRKIIMTPHIAFFSQESFIELRIKASEELLRMIKGKELKWRIA